MTKKILVFLGPPGVGKGTQAVKLADDLSLPHISTGDLFRDHLKRETELGQQAKEYMNAGKLVPDSLVVGLVMDRIAHDDCNDGFILDGFPRTVNQADELASALTERNESVSMVLYFDAPRETIVERISGRRTCRQCGAISHVKFSPTKTEGVCDVCGGETHQRVDDGEDKVGERLKAYDNDTGPLVPYYRERSVLVEFDGTKGVDDIYASVLDSVKKG